MATPGDVVLVQYNLPGPIVYHERLILCVCPNGDYGVLDPDLDTYSEDYSATNATLAGVTPSIGIGDTPTGMMPGSVYGFDFPLPSSDEMTRFVRGVCLATGSPLPPLPITVATAPGFGGAAGGVNLPTISDPLPPLATQVSPTGGIWVLDEPTVTNEIGDPFVLPTGALKFPGGS